MNKLFAFGIIGITLPFGILTGTAPAQVSQGAAASQAPAVNSPAGSSTSFNWSGYQATGGTFTGVTGTWTVPSVASVSSTQADATWVGIGGISSRDLIQAGTQAVTNNNGTVSYEAWYETLPQATQQVSLTVSPGDSMTASLSQTSSGQWSVLIRDNTTGQSYTASLAYASSLSSAEWIEEMPSDGSGFVPLDSFGSVSFTNGSATLNGDTVSISGSGATPITMVTSAGQALATTSALGTDGASFTVTRSGVSSGGFGIGPGGFPGGRWRRTGVGPQGYRTMPVPSSTQIGNSGIGNGLGGGSGSGYGVTSGRGHGFSYFGGGGGFGGGVWQGQFSRIIQQLQQLQINSYSRNTFRLGR